jgi:uncharacterized protein YndB with AHSA1/START domain
MSADAEATPGNRELVLHRTLGASRDKLYRCWTEADLLTQWFTPPPWTTPFATLDVRPGGANLVLMRGPKGEEMPNRGVYLEVVPNERLVFTDAYIEAWVSAPKPFMTVILTFEDAGPDRTAYTARVLHWTQEDCAAHEAMGFERGWGIATDQLEALAKTL